MRRTNYKDYLKRETMNTTKEHKFLISNDFKNSKKIKNFVLDKTYLENLSNEEMEMIINIFWMYYDKKKEYLLLKIAEKLIELIRTEKETGIYQWEE